MKRIFALVLTFLLIFSSFPVSVMADDEIIEDVLPLDLTFLNADWVDEAGNATYKISSNVGDNITLSVTAESEGVITYYWQIIENGAPRAVTPEDGFTGLGSPYLTVTAAENVSFCCEVTATLNEETLTKCAYYTIETVSLGSETAEVIETEESIIPTEEENSEEIYDENSEEVYLPDETEIEDTAEFTDGATAAELTVEYTELSCGTPVTFTLSSTGIELTDCKYLLNSVNEGGIGGDLVIDPSLGAFKSYQEENFFEFTFYAPGTYFMRFYLMGKNSGGTYVTAKRDLNLTISEDENHPTLDKICQSVASECEKNCTTDFDKAVWLHDWILSNCKYDYSYTYCSAEGALARGTGTCEAYHRAYCMLLEKVGIPYGRIEGNGHVWTAVQIDGKWCQVDATWDDNGYSALTDDGSHMYFGLDDTLMHEVHSDHSPNEGYISDTLDNNYFIRSGRAAQWASSYSDTIRQRIADGETEFTLPAGAGETETYDKKIKYTVTAYELSKSIVSDINGVAYIVECTYSNSTFSVKAERNVQVLASGTCGNQGENIKWELDELGVLNINGNGKMQDYSETSDAPWSEYKDSVITVEMNSGITSIGAAAFKNCSNMLSIDMPDTVQTIGSEAFSACSSLSNITVPAKTSSIAGDAFKGTTSLAEITVKTGNSYYKVTDGVLFKKDGKTLCLYPSAKEGTSYTVPSTVTAVSAWAFSNCINLEEIVCPESVTAIGRGAFSKCDKLKSFSFPSKIKSIESETFSDCIALTAVYVPSGVASIGENAFYNCPSLTSVCYGGEKEKWDDMIEEEGENLPSEGVVEYKTYPISYFNVDGLENPNPSLYKAGETLTLLPVSKENYEFLGWYKDASLKSKISSVSATSTGALKLYAKWTEGSYWISYNANGGTGSMKNTQILFTGLKALTANTFKRTGYTFKGWSRDENALNAEFTNKQTVSGLAESINTCVDLYAVWEPVEYTVIFSVNGGEGDLSGEGGLCRYGYSYALPTEGFSRDGFDFLGWSTSASGKVVFTSDSTFSNLTPTAGKKITLYAVWSSHKYSIKFNGNGETSGKTAAMTNVQCGKSITLPSNGFKRTGYTFLGWSENSDADSPDYLNRQKITNLTTGNGEVELYAVWTPTEYKINLKNVLETERPAGLPAKYTIVDSITLPSPSREGCTFEGWYTDSSCKKAISEIAMGKTGDITLYAKWSGNAASYEVTFDSSSATSGRIKPMTKLTWGKAYSLPSNTLKRTGYTFIGWSKIENAASAQYKDKAKIENLGSGGENVTLYPVWTPMSYKVTCKNVLACELPVDMPASYKTGDSFDLPQASRPYCNFIGWYTDSSCKKNINAITSDFTGNLILYAKFESSTQNYSISFNGNGADSGKMSTMTKRAFGKEYALTANSFKRTGYTFLGWSCNPNALEPDYINKQKVANLGDTALYAVWEPISYEIVYKNVSASHMPSKQSYTYDESVVFETPERAGYEFLGWYTSSDFKVTSMRIGIPSGTTGKVTVYARWRLVGSLA